MKVWLHIADKKNKTWNNEHELELERIPAVGEYFALNHKQYYEVVQVVTNHFECEYPYELYAVKSKGEKLDLL